MQLPSPAPSQLNLMEGSLRNTSLEPPPPSVGLSSLISSPNDMRKRVSSQNQVTSEHSLAGIPTAQPLEIPPLLPHPSSLSSHTLRSTGNARSSPYLFSQPSTPASPNEIPRVNQPFDGAEMFHFSFDLPDTIDCEQRISSEAFKLAIFPSGHDCSEPLAPTLPLNRKLINIGRKPLVHTFFAAIPDTLLSEVQSPATADFNILDFSGENCFYNDQSLGLLQFPFNIETVMAPLTDMDVPRDFSDIDPFTSSESNSSLRRGPPINETDFSEFLSQFSIIPTSYTQKITQLEMFKQQEYHLQKHIKLL